MLQEISGLLQSSRYAERKEGIMHLESYLREKASQSDQRQQVAALVGAALNDPNDLLQCQAIEVLLRNFETIQFDACALLPPLIALFKGNNKESRVVVKRVLAKILETNALPPHDLLRAFFGISSKKNTLTIQCANSLLEVLCKVAPIYGETKQLFVDLLFKTDNPLVILPEKIETKFRQIIGTHLWSLEQQRKVRLVKITENGSEFPVEGEFLVQFREFLTAIMSQSLLTAISPIKLEFLMRQFPPFPLDQCLVPFFFIETKCAGKRRTSAETADLEITAFLKNVLSLNFEIIGVESTAFSQTSFASEVTLNGEFHVHINLQKARSAILPIIFHLNILGKQVSITIPLSIPRPGDKSFVTSIRDEWDEKEVSIPSGTNDEYSPKICRECGAKNYFKMSEIFSLDPLYCKTCGILLKKRAELNFL